MKVCYEPTVSTTLQKWGLKPIDFKDFIEGIKSGKHCPQDNAKFKLFSVKSALNNAFNSLSDENKKVVENSYNSGEYKELIEAARNSLSNGNEGEYSKLKSFLPLVLPSVEIISKINQNELDSLDPVITKLFCIDIDHVKDVQKLDLQEVKGKLSQDPYIYACYVSPSNNGLKIFFKYELEGYEGKYWNQSEHVSSVLGNYLKSNYNIEADEACKDFLRRHYISLDEQAYYNENSKVFIIKPKKEDDNQLPSATASDIPTSGTQAKEITATENNTVDAKNTLPQQLTSKRGRPKRETYTFEKQQKKAAIAIMNNAIEALKNAPDGTRNSELNKAAHTLGGISRLGIIDKTTAHDTLEQIYQTINPNDLKNFDYTFESGWSKGTESPLKIETDFKPKIEYLPQDTSHKDEGTAKKSNNVKYTPFEDEPDQNELDPLEDLRKSDKVIYEGTLKDVSYILFENKGLYYISEKGTKHIITPINLFEGNFSILGYSRDENNEKHGKLLQVIDQDGVKHESALTLSEGKDVFIKWLIDSGLKVNQTREQYARLIYQFISDYPTDAKVRSASATGWTDNGKYILGNSKVIEKSDNQEKIKEIYRLACSNGKAKTDIYQQRGTVEDWKNHIAIHAKDNSRLNIAISAAFAGPLLHDLGEQNIGLHLKCASRSGKSTALSAAASVWGIGGERGNFAAKWNQTDNSLIAAANMRKDNIYILDEMGQATCKDIGKIIYTLGNGSDKGRATVNGDSKDVKNFQIIYLSAGEVSLEQALKNAGGEIKQGQEIRLLNIEAVNDKNQLFEIQERHKPSEFTEYCKTIKDSAAQYCGAVGVEYLQKYIDSKDESLLFVKDLIKKFVSEAAKDYQNSKYSSKENENFILSGARRFAVIAAGGELATKYGLTGWDTDTAYIWSMLCFESWCKNYSESTTGESLDVKIAYEIQSNIAQYRARFANEFGSKTTLTPCGGIIEKTDTMTEICYLLPFYLKECIKIGQIVQKNKPHIEAAKILFSLGILSPETTGVSELRSNYTINKKNTPYYPIHIKRLSDFLDNPEGYKKCLAQK